MQPLYVSDLTVNPDHWNPKKEEIKAKALVHPTEKAEMNKMVALQRFEVFKRLFGSKNFRVTFDSMTPDVLHEFDDFLRREYTFFVEYMPRKTRDS